MGKPISCELEPSAKQLWNAPPIDFGWVPRSAQADRLVEHLTAYTLRWERPSEKPRQRKRSKSATGSLSTAVARIAGGLAVATEHFPCVVRCPKDNNVFTTLPLTFTQFQAVYHAFMNGEPSLARLYEQGGWSVLFEAVAGPGVAGRGHLERIGPTEAFVSLLREHGIAKGTVEREHFRWDGKVPREQLIQLRSPSRWVYGEKIRGEPVEFEDTKQTLRMRDEIEELNEFLANVQVSGGDCAGWSRKFNQRDYQDYLFNYGARLFAWPLENSYQGLPKGKRKAITIEGERTTEIDLRSSHLTILYVLRGQSLADRVSNLASNDPYHIAKIPRPVVKLFVTVCLGNGTLPNRWPRGAAADMMDDEQIDLRRFPIASLRDAVLAIHPILSDLAGVHWGTLQFKESQAIIGTMLRLKREHHVLALPVHDSLIVPVSAEDITRTVLTEEFLATVGQPPILPAPSYVEPLAA